MTHSLRILHISDFHDRAGREPSSWRRQRVTGDSWLENMGSLKDNGPPFDLVLFTGDVAFSGQEDEFNGASIFIKSTLSALGVDSSRLFLVPGNHDIDRDISVAEWKALRSFWNHSNDASMSQWLAGSNPPPGADAAWIDLVMGRSQAYREWLKRLNRHDLLPENSPHKRLGYRKTLRLSRLPFPIHIVGLDSAWLAGDDNDAQKCRVSEDQAMMLSTAASGLALDGLRLGLIHHPLGELSDGGHCRTLLAGKIDLLLRGHLHSAETVTISDPDRALTELAAGCLYEHDRYPNGCTALTLGLDHLGQIKDMTLHFRTWSSQGHWHDDNSRYRASSSGQLRLVTTDTNGRKIFSYAPVATVSPAPMNATPQSRLHNLDMRPAQNFIGRDAELLNLERILSQTGRVGVAASVEGLPGIGKTEVTIQIVHRLTQTSEYPGGIFWLDAEQRDLVPTWGGPIANEMNIAPGSTSERAEKVIRCLSGLQPSRVLVVLDNVVSWDPAERPTPLPSGPHVTFLVTTQSRDLAGQGFTHLTLTPLKPSFAQDLLISLAGDERTADTGLAELLHHLDGHTLAIELAGAFLRRYPAVSADEYLKRLLAGARVEEKAQDQVRYSATVRAAFEATHERISAGTQSALTLCGCFADADASIELLRACGVNEESDAELRSLHLIQGGMSRWTMHRLVRGFARSLAAEAPDSAVQKTFWLGCYAVLKDAARQASAYMSDRPHFERLAERAMSGTAIALPTALAILDLVGRSAQAAGQIDSARRWLERRAELWSKVRDDQRSAFSDIRGEYIDPDGTTRPMPDPFIQTEIIAARARADTGRILLQSGHYNDAVEVFAQAVASLEARLGGSAPEVMTAYNGLVSALAEAGRNSDAEKIARRQMQQAKMSFGKQSIVLAETRAQLGLVLYRQGRTEEAIKLLEKSLSFLERDHAGLSRRDSVRSCLACVYGKAGRFQDSMRHFEQAISAMSVMNGDSHISTVQAKINFASIAMDSGDISRARLLLSSTESDAAGIDPNHPVAVSRQILLARVLAAEGDLTGAKILAKAARTKAEAFPPASPFRIEVEREASGIAGE